MPRPHTYLIRMITFLGIVGVVCLILYPPMQSFFLANTALNGLIVGALAVSLGLLANSWLVVIALAVSISFVITSVLYRNSHSQYHNH